MDMLDKKSRLYSDRPTLMMAGKFVGWGEGPALIPFCNTWLEYRRLFSQFMGTRSKVEAFNDVLYTETHAFLKYVRRDPAHWVERTRRYA